MSEYKFEEFNHQNILGVVIIFAQSVRKMLNAYLAFFAYSIFSDGVGKYVWWFFGISLVFTAVTSVLKYRNFRFKLDETQLVLNSGILTKDVMNIPLDRIQSVQMHQNFIQRILGITGLKIDTAGSSSEELEIPALKRKKAESLLELLKSKIRNEALPKSDERMEESSVMLEKKSIKETLVNLDFKAILVLAITENHIRNGLIAVAFIMGYAGQYLDYSEQFVVDVFDDYAPELVESGIALIVVFVFTFLLLSVLLSFIQVILKFFDFKAKVDDQSFYISSGLIKRNEFTIPLKKIQFLEWKTNLLRKRLGFESIRIHQGRSVESAGKNLLEIPSCYSEQTEKVMETLYAELLEDDYFFLLQPHTYQRVFRAIVLSLFGVPFFLIATIATQEIVVFSGLYLVYVFVMIAAAEKYYQSINLWVNEEVIIYERGWLFPKRTVVKLHKFQTVELNQTIFQAKRNICHLTFSTAAGGRSFRFFDKSEMEELRDFVLYKTESFTGKWM